MMNIYKKQLFARNTDIGQGVAGTKRKSADIHITMAKQNQPEYRALSKGFGAERERRESLTQSSIESRSASLQCVTRDNKFKPIKSCSGLLDFSMWRLYVKIYLKSRSFYADFYQIFNLWTSNKLQRIDHYNLELFYSVIGRCNVSVI